MPISVKATFSQDGVFFAGEKLNCTITFTNSSPSSAGLISAINGSHSGTSTPTRQSSSLQQKLQLHHDQQQGQQESNGHGNNNSQRNLAASSNAQSRNASNHQQQQQQQPPVASPTSSSSTPSALASPFGSPHNPGSSNDRPTAPLTQNATAHANNGSAPDTNLSTQPRSDTPQKRPGTTVSRAQSQTRLSSDISHIDVSQQDFNDKKHQQQGSSGDQDQDDQEEQERTIAVPALSDDEGATQSPVSSTLRQVQQIEQQQQQDGGLASISSPGLLGLASFVYRSASFSSLANAFGLSGSEAEQQHQQHPYGM